MTTLAESKINVRSIRHQMLLYLFCMKFYFSNLEKIDKEKSMFRNVIELGKSEFGEELINILEDIFLTNVERKGNDDLEKNDNECEEDKESCYLNDAIKGFISEICISTVTKKKGNKKTLTERSLYSLLGENIFHSGISAIAHDFAEEIQVGYYELGGAQNTWVLIEVRKLMFGDRHMSSSTSKNDQYTDTFQKILAQSGNKLIYITKKEGNKFNMIAMVIFAVLKNEDETVCSYILQLKTSGDPFNGVIETEVQKFRGNGIGRFLIELVKCYTYRVSTKNQSDVVLKSSNKKNYRYFKHIGFQEICTIDKWINAMNNYELKFKIYQQGKSTSFHLPHDTKIRHKEIVDPGQLKCLSVDDVIFNWSDDEIKKQMWGEFNKKNYMAIINRMTQQMKNLFVVHSILELHSISY